MTAATIGTSTGPRIRNRSPVVNSTSITPGDIGNAVIGAKGVAGAVGCGTSFCSRTCAIMTSAVWSPEPLGKIIRRKLTPTCDLQVSYTHAKSAGNLVAADPLGHQVLNLFDNYRGKLHPVGL